MRVSALTNPSAAQPQASCIQIVSFLIFAALLREVRYGFAGVTLSLTTDGTSWYEVARSN